MDNASPTTQLHRDPLSAYERLVVSALSRLALVWAFDTHREELLTLIAPALPNLRRDADFNALAAAAARMTHAKTTVERAFAISDCQSAIIPILRRDMMSALNDLPA
jgi:hypothetical protein